MKPVQIRKSFPAEGQKDGKMGKSGRAEERKGGKVER